MSSDGSGGLVPALGLQGWVWSNIDLVVCLPSRRESERPENLYHDNTVSGSSCSMLHVHAAHISFHISKVSLLFLSPLTSVQLHSIQIALVFHSLVVGGTELLPIPCGTPWRCLCFQQTVDSDVTFEILLLWTVQLRIFMCFLGRCGIFLTLRQHALTAVAEHQTAPIVSV